MIRMELGQSSYNIELQRGNLKRILLVATGALMNATIVQQGESIPVIAHAVGISVDN